MYCPQHLFRVFPFGNLWIGADVEKSDTKLMSKGSADIFIGIPNIETVITFPVIDIIRFVSEISIVKHSLKSLKKMNVRYL